MGHTNLEDESLRPEAVVVLRLTNGHLVGEVARHLGLHGRHHLELGATASPLPPEDGQLLGIALSQSKEAVARKEASREYVVREGAHLPRRPRRTSERKTKENEGERRRTKEILIPARPRVSRGSCHMLPRRGGGGHVCACMCMLHVHVCARMATRRGRGSDEHRARGGSDHRGEPNTLSAAQRGTEHALDSTGKYGTRGGQHRGHAITRERQVQVSEQPCSEVQVDSSLAGGPKQREVERTRKCCSMRTVSARNSPLSVDSTSANG